MRNTLTMILLAICWPGLSAISQLAANNEMLAFPVGWEEPQFIASNSNIQFQINIQNNTLGTVQNVVVSDIISEALNLDSFQPLSSSHLYELVINPVTREIQFIFDNISLLSMGDDIIASAAFVSFSLDVVAELEHGAVINNRASIDMDGVTIETNEIERTIFNCEEVVPFVLTDVWVCEGEVVHFGNGNSYFLEQTWSLDGENTASGPFFQQEFSLAGNYVVSLFISNPICQASSSHMVTVKSKPEASFFRDGNQLISSEGNYFQWYFNGAIIQGANTSTTLIQGDGYYSVEVFNEAGCSSISLEDYLTITGVDEIAKVELVVYPNPSNGIIHLRSEIIIESVEIYDLCGRLVFSELVDALNPTLSVFDLATGSFVLKTKFEDGRNSTQEISLLVR